MEPVSRTTASSSAKRGSGKKRSLTCSGCCSASPSTCRRSSVLRAGTRSARACAAVARTVLDAEHAQGAAHACQRHALVMPRALGQHQVDRELLHVGAAALRHAQQALAAEARQRAADGVAVDAELLGQRVLRRQALARRIDAARDRFGQLGRDAGPEAVARGARRRGSAGDVVMVVMKATCVRPKLAPVVRFVYTTFPEYHPHVSCL